MGHLGQTHKIAGFVPRVPRLSQEIKHKKSFIFNLSHVSHVSQEKNDRQTLKTYRLNNFLAFEWLHGIKPRPQPNEKSQLQQLHQLHS